MVEEDSEEVGNHKNKQKLKVRIDGELIKPEDLDEIIPPKDQEDREQNDNGELYDQLEVEDDKHSYFEMIIHHYFYERCAYPKSKILRGG